jgi:diguanylate cyclase (GGDEF)-like protein
LPAAVGRISNRLLSFLAGAAAFILTLLGFLLLRGLDQQIAASLIIGLFGLLVVWVAAERPNSRHARAVAALIDRLMAVHGGDLASPAPALVREEMPALAAAVDGLFEQVRSNLDNVNAMALYDPVTSLPNRLHFKREAERILKERAEQDRTALLFIDLDGFKEVNDRLGHAQGDQVLVMVANRLRIVIKAEGRPGAEAQPLIARLAGDEFTILLPGVGSRAEAERIADRALAALGETFRLAGVALRMGGSIGISLCPDHGGELTGLMKAADIAMYEAKASGRSRICVYDAGLARACEDRAAAEARLRHAIEQESFELAYQPQLSIRTGAVDSIEALLCWRQAGDGIGPPEGFLDLAEESRLILDVGQWSIDAAAEALARWRAAGIKQRMSLKVSQRLIERPDFFPLLREALSRSGPPPWPVELGISERAASLFAAPVRADLAALRKDGVTIAIDDFGSGFASLAGIGDLPADRIRLSRSIIAGIDRSEPARNVAAALIHLIHGLGCEAVAEGVDRPEQLEVLRAIGCDAVQGGSLAAAMGERAMVGWVEARQCQEPPQPLARAS